MPKPSKTADMPLPLVQLAIRARDASGLSVKEFAKVRGIPYATLRHYLDPKMEPLKMTPRPATLRNLATALDVPLSEVQRAADLSLARVYSREVSTADGSPVTILMASIERLSEQEQKQTIRELQKLLRDRASGGGS